MNETTKSLPESLSSELPKDIQVLREIYKLGHLKYIDFFQLEQLSDMMSKWSLIHELAELKEKSNRP